MAEHSEHSQQIKTLLRASKLVEARDYSLKLANEEQEQDCLTVYNMVKVLIKFDTCYEVLTSKLYQTIEKNLSEEAVRKQNDPETTIRWIKTRFMIEQTI